MNWINNLLDHLSRFPELLSWTLLSRAQAGPGNIQVPVFSEQGSHRSARSLHHEGLKKTTNTPSVEAWGAYSRFQVAIKSSYNNPITWQCSVTRTKENLPLPLTFGCYIGVRKGINLRYEIHISVGNKVLHVGVVRWLGLGGGGCSVLLRDGGRLSAGAGLVAVLLAPLVPVGGAVVLDLGVLHVEPRADPVTSVVTGDPAAGHQEAPRGLARHVPRGGARPLVAWHAHLLGGGHVSLGLSVIEAGPLERVGDLRRGRRVGRGGRVSARGWGVWPWRGQVLRLPPSHYHTVLLRVERPVLGHFVPHGSSELIRVILTVWHFT